MLFNWLLALDSSELGISVFDFFSLGHITFGIGVFLFFSLFYTLPKNKGNTPIFSLLFVFLCTVGVLIAWEFIENILFIQWGLKFEGRGDSIVNIISDVALGVVGALVMWYFCHLMFEKDKNIKFYYFFGITSFFIWLVFFFVGRYFTFWYAAL